MSHDHPSTPQEWERFRFPRRVLRPRIAQADGADGAGQDEGGGDEEGEAGRGGEAGAPGPEFPPPPKWEYCAQTGFLKNLGLKKKIDLAHLDEAQKIVRMLAVFELRPDLAFASLRRALEAATQDRFGVSVEDLLRRHADGQAIAWKPTPHSHPGM